MLDVCPRLWYEGVDTFLTWELRKGLSVSWGDVTPGAALVGTVRCFCGVLDRIQLALEAEEAVRSTLVEPCTEVTQAVDSRETADRWSMEVYAVTRAWPASASGVSHSRGLSR